ncbi:hypothetical protein P3T76_009681 [Phytophthora citrophthora]|uniref:HTH CENPB-type domain-containing protein n=1 Tax=Phytophthora citrophthora TaxID=4793 RepID=A0AAD9LJS6_9STRA|nr:hypothetical protein P3T76_009681 [Phytophthora citrophthora]
MPSSKKKVYVRLTLGQKAILCKIAREKPRDLSAPRDFAMRVFDLPRPPAERTIYNILKTQDKILKLTESSYSRKKFFNPVFDEIDQALVNEFDVMETKLSTITDYGLMYRSKDFCDKNFGSLPAAMQPGFSKGWAYRFRKLHGIRCVRKQGEAASVKKIDVAQGRERMRKITDLYNLRDTYNMDETSFFSSR